MVPRALKIFITLSIIFLTHLPVYSAFVFYIKAINQYSRAKIQPARSANRNLQSGV